MSGFTSGIGLVTGLPSADLISQFMALERRPITLLETRVAGIQTQRTAWADLTARLLAVKAAVSRFGERGFFQNFNANSTDENVLTAVAGDGASPGSFDFAVHSLVTNHQLVGRGFADADTTPIGAGALTVEIGRGRVNPATDLDQLNGGSGARRGTIRITDRAGATIDVDLSTAITLNDVIQRINAQATANVEARLSGDRLVISDRTAPAAAVGNLSVTDIGGGATAADLGIAQTTASETITGADILYLVDSTSLDGLNDGNGVRHHVGGNDFRITQASGDTFEVSLDADMVRNPATDLAQLNSGNGVRTGTIRITDRSGATADVDLSAAQTVQDVVDAVNSAGIGVTASLTRDHFLISDTTGTSGETAVNLKIEDVDGFAARDLGIAGDVEEDTISGSTVFRISTIGDVIRAINYAPGNLDPGQQVIASISADGNGLVLTSQSLGTGSLTVEAIELNGILSGAAADLGVLGTFASGTTDRRDLIAGPNTVLLSSLRGGRGIDTLGTVEFSSHDGNTTQIDLSAAQTLQGVVDLINAVSDASGISAAVNSAGNGVQVTDASNGAGSLTISDVGEGTTAADLGLAGTHAAATVNGGNLQLRYVSENTQLEDLNYRAGIRTGRFLITDSGGLTTTVNLTDNQKTLQDVIGLINSGTASVTARINDNGDGLLITDAAGGTGALSITDLDGGRAAADLNIAGQAADGETTIDGSYEISLNIDADDSLRDVVTKINDASSNIRAAVLNDGSANGHRLTLTSLVSGRGGELVFDTGDTGLAMETLVRAQDAVVFFGGAGTHDPVVITSSTNTLSDAIQGVTIDLVGTSDEPVTLSVAQDVEGVIADIETFVTSYNAVLDRIDEHTAFDPDTLERGVLLGDSTLRRVQSRLHDAVTREYDNVPPEHSRLFSIGLSAGSGGRLEFDKERFREAYAADPSSVELLFSTEETGAGAYLDELFDDLTRTEDGLIAQADNLLADRQEDLQDRIETLELLLGKKQARLESQFAVLEETIAMLQGQQNALAAISLPQSAT